MLLQRRDEQYLSGLDSGRNKGKKFCARPRGQQDPLFLVLGFLDANNKEEKS